MLKNCEVETGRMGNHNSKIRKVRKYDTSSISQILEFPHSQFQEPTNPLSRAECLSSASSAKASSRQPLGPFRDFSSRRGLRTVGWGPGGV